MAKELTAFGFAPTLITVLPTGASALLIQCLPGEVSGIIKYFSGGSLEIMNAPFGATSPGTSLAPGTGYLMGSGEAVTYTGAARYYLVATGATTQAYLLRGLGQGY